MAAVFAFLHHLAVASLVAALAVEVVLFHSDGLPSKTRAILRADLAFGLSAAVVLVIGLIRVIYFEQGQAYYLHSVPFIAKVSLFLLVGLLSIYPTMEFLSWRKNLKTGLAPRISDRTARNIRRVMYWEVTGVVGILLCAALMAKGVGSF